MKRIGLMVLTACLASSAYAQSSVTLFGLLDEGFTFNSNVGGGRLYELSTNAIQGERWGIRGTEDLGGGLKAIFTLENGFNINNGALAQGGRLFGRQAFVGLTSDHYGTLTFGRQYDAGVDFVEPLTVAGTIGGYGGHPMDNDNLQDTFRFSNSVKYRSPTYDGITGEAVYGFSNTAGGMNENSAWSFGARYQGPGLSLAAAVMRLDHPAANTNGAVGASGGGTTSDFTALSNSFVSGQINSDLIISSAASYTFGSATLALAYSHVLYGMDTTSVRFDNFEGDATYYITPVLMVSGSFTYTMGKVNHPELEPRWYTTSAILDYFLSKRTDLYVLAAYQRAAGDAQFANIFTAGGNSSSQNQTVARVGIRFRF